MANCDIAPGSDSDRPHDRPRVGHAERADQRSRITNHADLLPDVKGNSAAARRFRDLVRSYIVDQGGLDRCAEVKLGLLRRLAALTVQAEQLEAAQLNGDDVDIAKLCNLDSTILRLSSRLGLERRAKPVKTLDDHLREKAKARALQRATIDAVKVTP